MKVNLLFNYIVSIINVPLGQAKAVKDYIIVKNYFIEKELSICSERSCTIMKNDFPQNQDVTFRFSKKQKTNFFFASRRKSISPASQPTRVRTWGRPLRKGVLTF